MNNWKETLLNYYIEKNAILSGKFKLKNGAIDNLYIDNRIITTSSIGLKAIITGMNELIEEFKLLSNNTNIVVPAISGISIGKSLSLNRDIQFIIDRGKFKNHGTCKRFEGLFSESKSCLVIDDLITKGITIIQTIEGLNNINKSVKNVLVVIDREENGKEILNNLGITLHSLLTKTELLEIL